MMQPIIVEPKNGLANIGLAEVWRYRDLLYFLAWRDVKVRYKQTLFGAAWAVIQPVSTMIVFTIFFGRLAGIPSDGFPYPVYTFVALIPWQLFAHSLTHSSQSLVAEARLITKVYFPRLIVPFSSILAGLVDFAIALGVLAVLMAYYGVPPTINILFLPFFVATAIVSALAVGLWLSALNVKYRDVRYTLPFLTQLWLLASPVGYPSSVVPEAWRAVYGLNPMAGVVEGFRWALLGSSPPLATLYVSGVLMMGLLIGGLYYFRHVEKEFADIA